MTLLNGVNLLPASGEWVYDTVPHRSQQVTQTAPVVANLYFAPGGTKTDYSYALDQLQAQHPECTTVALVVAWFGSSTDATQCKIHPSTTYIGGGSDALVGGNGNSGTWQADPWRCSGLTQASGGLIPISQVGNSFVYGGTPADPAVVRCLRDLKSRGLRTVFYPFLLMDCPGYPWRGRITFAGADISSAATTAVTTFLGSAVASQFTRDTTNLTVAYGGSATDYTYRRMILHYANLCVVAGGVDLFLIGSELRGLEILRGPAWTPAGTTDGNGHATWDYPFVAGLAQLAADVRGVFDSAGLARDPVNLHNLVSYSADWSVWMGVQHPAGSGYFDGQWPHLDGLYASTAIDFVTFDNYLPLSDWTSGTGGLDAANWQAPAPTVWPPTAATMNGLGLTGAPTLASKAYLKANIEGGEKYGWFYLDSTNDGRGLDPNGSDQPVSRPEGDRLAQARSPYQPGQQLLANKMLRWWWLNPHQAVYETGDGQGAIPRGPMTAWAPQSKSIMFAEYGFPTTDRCTNQPNVFYDPKSSESFTPYWSAWALTEGCGFAPVRDNSLAQLALQAIYEYWVTDGHNATSAAGIKMIEPTFMSAWNWDARPFPIFPALSEVWGDAANWPAGTWIGGKGPFVAPTAADAPPTPPASYPSFPALPGQACSARYRPLFATLAAAHVSGRESRAARRASVRWQIEFAFDFLRMDGTAELQALAAFCMAQQGEDLPFAVAVPAELGQGATLLCRFADDAIDMEEFMARLWRTQSLTLVSVPA